MEGSIFAKELRDLYGENGGFKRVCEVPYEPDAPVFTAWDIGFDDDTAIWWFQVIGNEIRVIDFYANCHQSVGHYASQILGKEVLIDLVEEQSPYSDPGMPATSVKVKAKVGRPIKELAHRRQYKYAFHWLPFDSKMAKLDTGGRSVLEQLVATFGFNHVRLTPHGTIENRIQAARMIFPRCWFDESKCSEGLRSLRRYQRELQTDEKSFKKDPKHDWASHAADAFTYLCVVCTYKKRAIAETKGRYIDVNGDSTLTLNDMWNLLEEESQQ